MPFHDFPVARPARLTGPFYSTSLIDSMTHSIYFARMHEDQAEEVAVIYRDHFAGFLADLGQDFLTVYFREYCYYPFDFPMVAIEEEGGHKRVIGFIIGSADLQAHNRNFYRKYFFRTFRIFLRRLLTHKGIRAKLIRFFTFRQFCLYLAHLLKQIFNPRGKSKEASNQSSAYMIFFAVIDSFQGTGLAKKLYAYYEEVLVKNGIREGITSVNPINARALRFYLKNGWSINENFASKLKEKVWMVKRYEIFP